MSSPDAVDAGTADGDPAEGVVADARGTGALDPPPDDGQALGAGLRWSRAVILLLAVAFLGGAVGYLVGTGRPPSADSVEVGFAQDMLRHHEQAIELAKLELANGTDPTARAFAEEVLIFQSYEMGLLDQMLADWGYNRQERSDEAMTWMDHAVPVEAMPGMVPEEQLDELAAAEGAEADALFLELMIGHHEGGIHMADAAAERTGNDRLREVAEIISRNQALEIEEYEQLLAKLPPT